ncbi:MAG: hypothetical protein ACK5OX_18975 [Desertimonas sp.]
MTNPTTERPEQLTLPGTAEVPVQFRLDEATRRRGLAHISQIRNQLDQAHQRRLASAPAPRRRQAPRRSPVAPRRAA